MDSYHLTLGSMKDYYSVSFLKKKKKKDVVTETQKIKLFTPGHTGNEHLWRSQSA